MNQLSEAKKYIDKVINQMAKSDTDLTKILRKYVRELIEVSMTYSYLGKSFHFADNPALEKKVSLIMEQLRNDIFNTIYMRCDYVDTLASDKEQEEKSNKFLLLFLGTKIAGATLQDRINQYVMQLRSEIEAYIAVGISGGMLTDQILANYLTFLKYPYRSPILLDAFKRQGFKAERIRSRGISLSTGKYTSAFNNLKRLQQTAIIQAYNNALNSIWLGESDIIGWYTVRGSDYPCTLCDDNKGVFHPKDEFFLGYHVRCTCIMLPIYQSQAMNFKRLNR